MSFESLNFPGQEPQAPQQQDGIVEVELPILERETFVNELAIKSALAKLKSGEVKPAEFRDSTDPVNQETMDMIRDLMARAGSLAGAKTA